MKLVILDRDGVINQESKDFIKSPEEWIALPGSLEAIAKLCRQDYKVIVATNQSGVGRGLFSVDTLNKIHTRMLDRVNKKGGAIEAIFFCPHGPEQECGCRKPRAQLYRDIESRLKASLAGVPSVGDSLRDIQAAKTVNALPILVRTGNGKQTEDDLKNKDGKVILDDVQIPVFDDLASFTSALIRGQLNQKMSELSMGPTKETQPHHQ
ncbi:D-glycero-beta-D-manno-heptose 1,7-bisphosphate 7-phosphatase [Pseudomonadota bacterium]